MYSDLLEIVPTKAMLMQKSTDPDYKVTVFEAPNKMQDIAKKSLHNVGKSEKKFPIQSTKDDKKNEFNIRKVRQEVLNFGLTGFASQDKKSAQIDKAVRLGAVAPKRPFKNYKELLSEKKTSKDAKKAEEAMLQLGKNQTGAATVRYRAPKASNKKHKKHLGDVSQHYGKVNPKIIQKRKRK